MKARLSITGKCRMALISCFNTAIPLKITEILAQGNPVYTYIAPTLLTMLLISLGLSSYASTLPVSFRGDTFTSMICLVLSPVFA